ncbi:hypothetical protein L208DRAFT_1380874 [Tricholoma matsutake]|nr:hypothetical protein L208DRAFT_1380874 [Tricholoma matsutake 945]
MSASQLQFTSHSLNMSETPYLYDSPPHSCDTPSINTTKVAMGIETTWTTTVSSFTPQAELRMPPANPHKSRRRCIDFGLGRSPATLRISSSPQPPSSPDEYPLLSPPLAAHASHDSDTSSLFDDIEMVFPQPPPIFTTLRRVHSSPFLTAKETCLAKNVMENHWDRKLLEPQGASNKHRSMLYNATPAQAGHRDSMDRSDKLFEQLEPELEGEALLCLKTSVMNAVRSRPLAAHTTGSSNYGHSMNHAPVALSAAESRKSISFPNPSCTNKSCNTVLCDSKYTPTAINPVMTGKGRKLSHTRSTSSLFPVLPRIIHKEKMTTLATFEPTRKIPSKAKSITVAASDSCDHLEPSFRKPKALRPQQLDRLGIQSYQKTTKRAQLSNRFASLSFQNASLVPPRSLGSPFHHRPTQSQLVAHATMTNDSSPNVPKSFMDITPEQDSWSWHSRLGPNLDAKDKA